MERYDLDGIIKGTEKDASLERIGCAKKDEKERIINTTEMEARKNNRKLVSIERDLKLEKFKSMPQTSLIRGTNEIKTEEIPPLRLQQYCRSLKEKKDQFMGLINFKHKLTI